MVLASKFMKMKSFGKQPQFINKFFALLFVFALLCPLTSVNAQLISREPQSGMISLQRTGLNSAVAEVACASGDVTLQNAVLLQYADEKPQYIHYDDGRKPECIAGSCMQGRGETGQQRTRCAPKRTDIKWFKREGCEATNTCRDVRSDADAFLTNDEQNYFSGVARISCIAKRAMRDEKTKKPLLDKNGNAIFEDVDFKSTAFHVASFDTMVTNAHAFTQDGWDPVNKKVIEIKTPSRNCSAVFFDSNGREIERVAIAFVESRWDKPGFFGDKSNDIAMIKLTRESSTTSTALPYVTDMAGRIDGLPVSVVGFHGDVTEREKKRKTKGVIYKAPTGFHHETEARTLGLPFRNRSNVIIGDYPTNHGSSGSPILNSDGKVIGIHQGNADRINADGTVDRSFNKMNNYNLGILFDEQFYQDINRFKSLKPSVSI